MGVTNHLLAGFQWLISPWLISPFSGSGCGTPSKWPFTPWLKSMGVDPITTHGWEPENPSVRSHNSTKKGVKKHQQQIDVRQFIGVITTPWKSKPIKRIVSWKSWRKKPLLKKQSSFRKDHSKKSSAWTPRAHKKSQYSSNRAGWLT